MSNFLILSNGHGEDLSGATIGKELKRQGHNVEAMPLVGLGSFYTDNKISLVGKQKEFTTGGLGYTSLYGRVTEILQGQIIFLIKNLFRLFFVAKKYDFLLVVGDVVPILGAWLTNLPVIVYLVAYSSHYEGRLRMPWPSQLCLSSKRFMAIYCRDQLTCTDLNRQLSKPVFFLGNPFMDEVLKPTTNLSSFSKRLGILPGSRMPELAKNISLLLKVVTFLPETYFQNNQLSINMALVRSLDNSRLKDLADFLGWNFLPSKEVKEPDQLLLGDHKINIYRDSFVEVLQSSDIVLAMAGTASEQAVGLSKPLVQLPGEGPQFTLQFAEAQRRLLGPTVFCADYHSSNPNILQNTAELILELFSRIDSDNSLQDECNYQAQNRLGNIYGVTEKMVMHMIEVILDPNYLRG